LNPVKRALVAAFSLFATLSSPGIEAKRSSPKEVKPVVAAGVRYRVEHFGVKLGRPQNGGYVDAENVKTGKLLWSRMVYRVRYDTNLEKDAQDVFIIEIKLVHGRLLVKTERSEEFEMDLASGRVRALTPLGPRVEVA
jgi:outer membrane protein assembly factor BamB